MTFPGLWLVLLPAQAVRPGAPPVPARLRGEDLVAWRTAAGALQVWHDRCPHRGVRLSLGRVETDHLACAYHGWAFRAGDGRCTQIPALADLAQVPGDVRATPWPAREHAGMVWVHPGAGPSDGAPPGIATDDARFLRTLTLRVPPEALQQPLQDRGFAPLAGPVWQGALAGRTLRLFVQEMQPDLLGLHAWDCDGVRVDDPLPVLAALRQLRDDVEATSGGAGAR